MPEFFKARKGHGPQRLASTTGHVVIVGENWQEVPEILVPEALKSGLLSKELYEAALAEVRGDNKEPPSGPPAGDPDADAAKKAEAEAEKAKAEEAEWQAKAQERHRNVLLAIQKVMELHEAGETATPKGNGLVSQNNGLPKVDAVSEFAGFKVAAAEIEEALK